jgi:signal transduction histidine kinase
VDGAVEDDGLGFGIGNGQVGRVGMSAIKERAALLGSVVRLSSWPDAGTKVEVSVPLTEEDVR